MVLLVRERANKYKANFHNSTFFYLGSHQKAQPRNRVDLSDSIKSRKSLTGMPSSLGYSQVDNQYEPVLLFVCMCMSVNSYFSVCLVFSFLDYLWFFSPGNVQVTEPKETVPRPEMTPPVRVSWPSHFPRYFRHTSQSLYF